MTTVILLAVLHFTAPSQDADLACRASVAPCLDLAIVRLYGQPRWGAWRVVREKSATAGAADTLIVPDAGVWSYALTAVDSSGNESCWSNIVQVGGAAGAGPAGSGFALAAPRPNPARRLVAFQCEAAAGAELTVCDVAGRVVARFAVEPGAPRIVLWDCRAIPPGIYLARLVGNGHSAVRRVLVVR